MVFLHLAIFIASSFFLAIAGDWLVRSLARIARYFGWKDFLAAFFIMSFAVSIPELLVGVSAALSGVPELSFGNIMGANMIHFTLAIALAALVLGGIGFDGKVVRTSADFTIIIALLPFLLMLDGNLSRLDGAVMIGLFLIYTVWILSKKDHFRELYTKEIFENHNGHSPLYKFRAFMKDLGVFIVGILLLLVSAQGLVSSASFFAAALNIPLVLVGIFIIGLGTALPETYFAIASARRGNSWMVIGNLMGSTVFTASFVLGLVAIIHPIQIVDFSPYIVTRAFLVLAAVVFLIFSRTERKITHREALTLLVIYIIFILTQLTIRCCAGAV